MNDQYPPPVSPYPPSVSPYPPPPGVVMPFATAPLQPDAPKMLPPGGWSPPNMTYPPGLEYLIDLDYLFVNQKIELSVQVFVGWRTDIRYAITNNKGEPMFYMTEDSGICWRLCVGEYRSCEFNIYDKNQREILRMVRPFRCDSFCCPCYLQILEVYSGSTLLGSVTQEWSFWPKFYVRDASGQPVLVIKGPLLRCCINVIFKIKSVDEKHRIGTIRKQWSGFARQMFTAADAFGINFPRDLDVKIKAILLGACILINIMYFENSESVITGA